MSLINSQSALALAEGFSLALSPCILPILPFILAASAVGNRARPFLIISGFIASFTIFALISRKILAISGLQQDTIQYGAYGLLFVFGLTMLIPAFEHVFARLTNNLAGNAEHFSSGKRAEGPLGALLVGTLIGVVWTPCAGPLLAAALLQVIQSQTNVAAMTTMLAFSIGAGIPMLAIALFGQQLSHRVRALAKHATGIRRGMGVIIVIFALCGLVGFNVGQLVGNTSPTMENAAPAIVSSSTGNTANTSTGDKIAEADTQGPKIDAPEIAGIMQWFNSDPLTIADLKGKVVLIDFWTYSCINCIRTLPNVESWYEKYKDKGLVVIGVHSPEFPFEGKPDNVAMAIKKFGITYPVAMDNDFATWKNYKNEYWPAHYLIDQQGKIVETHFGEGGYAETENAIRGLLGLDKSADMPVDAVVSTSDQSPETYLGFERARNFSSVMHERDKAQTYAFPSDLEPSHWGLSGEWTIGGEHLTAAKSNAKLRFHFNAGKVYLVMGTKTGKPVTAKVTLDGKALGNAAGRDSVDGTVTVDQQRLYELVNQPTVTSGTLEITANDAGLEAYAFTFGK